MTQILDRRSFLHLAATLPFAVTACASSAAGTRVKRAVTELQALESAAGVRLGVFALDIASGAQIAHREDERFAFCSTFKVILAAAILDRSTREPGLLLDRRVEYTKNDLVSWSPVTEKHLDAGMTVEELCAAAIRYSDNTAANLLIRILGAPEEVTAYARAIGNDTFRLDRWETELNTAIPGDPRDTVTPRAMARSLDVLIHGDALRPAERGRLTDWMLANTTGGKRIRAGVPEGWRVADKTGSGAYGTTNDIGVIWSPDGEPIILAIYLTGKDEKAPWRDDTVAEATRVVVRGFAGEQR